MDFDCSKKDRSDSHVHQVALQEKSNFGVLLVFILIFIFGIAVRFETWKFYIADLFGHLNFFDPDSFYQLRRVAYFVQNFPHTLRFDRLADWPNGSWVDWPDALVWFVGLPLRILGLRSFRSVEISASTTMIFFALLFSYFQYRLGSALTKSKWIGLVAMLFVLLHPFLVQYSALGRFDHHIVEFGFVSLATWLIFKFDQSGKAFYLSILGLLSYVGLNFSSSFLFVIGFGILCLALLSCSYRFWLYFLLSLLVPLVVQSIWNWHQFGFLLRIDFPSFFHAISILGFAGLIGLLSYARQKKKLISTICVLLALAGCLLVMSYFKLLDESIIRIWKFPFEYVFGRSGSLVRINEAQPLLFYHGEFDWRGLIRVFGILGLAFPYVFYKFINWKRFCAFEKIVFLGFVVYSILAFSQRRFSPMLIPFCGLVFCLMLSDLFHLLSGQTRVLRAAILSLSIFLFLYPGFKAGFVGFDPESKQLDYSIVASTRKSLGRSDDEVFKYLGRAQAEDLAIASNPNLGHMLEYVTGVGVGSNSFFHGSGLRQDYELRLKTSDKDLLEFLKDRKFSHLLILDDFRYFEFLSKMFDGDGDFFEKLEGDSRIYRLDVLSKYAFYRWMISPDLLPVDLRNSVYFSLEAPGKLYFNHSILIGVR